MSKSNKKTKDLSNKDWKTNVCLAGRVNTYLLDQRLAELSSNAERIEFIFQAKLKCIEVWGEGLPERMPAAIKVFDAYTEKYKKTLSEFSQNKAKKNGNNTLGSKKSYGTNPTVAQLALMCIYRNIKLYRGESANELATLYGFNSGDHLFNKYTHFLSTQNRVGKEESKRRTKHKLKDITAVVDFLKGESGPVLIAMSEKRTLEENIKDF